VRREGFGKDGRFLLVLPSVGAGDVAGERIASNVLAKAGDSTMGETTCDAEPVSTPVV